MEKTVSEAENGMRLSSFLRGVMKVSYTAMKSAKWNGRILVDGQPRNVDQPVRSGETVCFELKAGDPVYRIEPWPVSLRVPYQDEWLMVIDKPAPMASTSGSGQLGMSLENAVFSHLGCPEGFIYRPVNRLDKGTSGLMAVALNAHAQQRLQSMLHTDDFVRTYLAVVEGVPAEESGVIDLPIRKEDAASVRRVIAPDGKPSVTRWEKVMDNGKRSLLRLRLETGRTHQIRVHCRAMGCPVCGDFLYGTELPELPGRFALHSAQIGFRHPVTGEMIRYESPLPEGLTALLQL